MQSLSLPSSVLESGAADVLTLPIDILIALFDASPDTAFFIKDTEGRYTSVNLTLVRRARGETRQDVIGKKTTDLFPNLMGTSYATQDQYVLRGNILENQLEAHPFDNVSTGWCVTSKYYLKDGEKICGLVGISRDLGLQERRESAYKDVGDAMGYIQENYHKKISVAGMAEVAGLSVARLERLFRRAFHITPQQMVTKLRIESAMERLHGDRSVADIALSCGFVDHSAFSRQFKTTVGMSPRDYRRLAAMARIDPAASGRE